MPSPRRFSPLRSQLAPTLVAPVSSAPTLGWLPRICSTSVLPERIMPTIKDRHRRGVAEVSPFADQRGGEDPTHAVEPLQHCRLVIDDLPPLERIAVEQMAERTLMLPDVRVTLAEREIELDLLFVGERCSIVDQRLKRREVRVAEGD